MQVHGLLNQRDNVSSGNIKPKVNMAGKLPTGQKELSQRKYRKSQNGTADPEKSGGKPEHQLATGKTPRP
jgi:hypothetical protein